MIKHCFVQIVPTDLFTQIITELGVKHFRPAIRKRKSGTQHTVRNHNNIRQYICILRHLTTWRVCAQKKVPGKKNVSEKPNKRKNLIWNRNYLWLQYLEAETMLLFLKFEILNCRIKNKIVKETKKSCQTHLISSYILSSELLSGDVYQKQ